MERGNEGLKREDGGEGEVERLVRLNFTFLSHPHT